MATTKVTTQKLREYCKRLSEDKYKVLILQKKGRIIEEFNSFFNRSYILLNKPWRAIEGTKKCKPIEIPWKVKDCEASLDPKTFKNIMNELGFVVKNIDGRTFITIPEYEKGQKVTFAEQWKRKINNRYSKNIQRKMLEAKNYYSLFVTKLIEYDVELVDVYHHFVFFENGRNKIPIIVDDDVRKEFFKLLKKNEIEVVYSEESNVCLGVKVRF